ncbi:hypothetical protein HPC49_31005 [Pyxidicoccus fallax]|uniref:Uncharacterized protein n=1 Tax=Pyxidicoccus fallax TaxID=394095 RepID=A0A848LC28_9BACT|nr:hypothetical protein [Pyxidicoccus fallax]NMO15792.1 hypothetical protein [Pyxidicoccus fallax]NPC82640.1 hypothetical protein [Pyxidicoccus fallax]
MKHRLWMFVVMVLGSGAAMGATGPVGPIVVPHGPGEDPDSTEIGDPPPNGPRDPGDIQPQVPAHVAGPVRLVESSGPILFPTGPGDEPDSGEIGDDPPNGPNDPGDIQPQRLPWMLAVAGHSAGFFDSIPWPTGPGEEPDSTEIGDKPPPDPDDTGGICPRSSGDVA